LNFIVIVTVIVSLTEFENCVTLSFAFTFIVFLVYNNMMIGYKYKILLFKVSGKIAQAITAQAIIAQMKN